MFLSFNKRMPEFREYIVAYGNNEGVETVNIDDLTAKRAYNSVKNWLHNTDKQIYGVYIKRWNDNEPILLINEMGEYI